ncbi:hypothetical protein CsatB_025192 [Cannabis sativa]
MADECPCPAGKSSWPELVGKNGDEAAKTIGKENGNVMAFVILEGTIVTKEFSCERVRVWVNHSGIVIQVPKIG